MGPAGNGPSIANQVITFTENTDNPTGNTFVPFSSPTTTVTFSLSNQQYTLPFTELSTQKGVCFGAAINNGGTTAPGFKQYGQMNSISAAPDNDFTSLSYITAGTGISVANNYATEVFCSALPFYHANLSVTGRFYVADLTITFSVPLANPILHIVGIGAFSGSQGFTTELECQTAGVTFTELSGSTELNVTSTKILNSAAHPSSATGSGAASGSIWVHTAGVSKLVFKLYVRGDGNGTWATSTSHSGDQWLIGVSTDVVSIILPVNLADFTATPQSGKTKLQWTTATEDNSSYFNIQHSTDQITWESIGAVKAAGNSNTANTYSFIHADPTAGNNYYRLRIVNLDSQAVYSPIRVASFAATAQLSYYPNPTRDNVTLTTNGTTLASVTVLSLDGRQLQQFHDFTSGSSISLGQYPTGLYLIAIKDNTGKTQLLKVLKD